MGVTLEMAKCSGCNTYFWTKHLTNGKCGFCLTPCAVPKKIVANQEPPKENQQADNSSDQK